MINRYQKYGLLTLTALLMGNIFALPNHVVHAEATKVTAGSNTSQAHTNSATTTKAAMSSNTQISPSTNATSDTNMPTAHAQRNNSNVIINKYVTIEQNNTNIFNDLSTKKVIGNTNTLTNKTYLAKVKVSTSNGQTYYELYNHDSKSIGFVSAKAVKIAPNAGGISTPLSKQVILTPNAKLFDDLTLTSSKVTTPFKDTPLKVIAKFNSFNGVTYYKLLDKQHHFVGYVAQNDVKPAIGKTVKATKTVSTPPKQNNKVVTTTAKSAPGYALAPYVARNFKTVANIKTTVNAKAPYAFSPNYFSSKTFETKRNTIKTARAINGAKVNLKTKYFLPVAYKANDDLSNVQGLVIDGSNYYTTISTEKRTGKPGDGYIVRYDMAGLNKYINKHFKGAARTSALRQTFKSHQQYQSGRRDKSVKKYNKYYKPMKKFVKISKQMNIGHGQAFSRNPKTGELWLLLDHDNNKGTDLTTVAQVNKSNLTLGQKTSFKLKDTVPMGHNLTFDNNGNAYFYTISKSGSGDSSVGWNNDNIKIYKGCFGNGIKPHWELIMQGLKYKAGTYGQSMSFNPRTNSLLLVSDSSIQSFPVAKLGKLKPSDIRETVFNTKREFEAMPFDSQGNIYLFTPKGSEIFKSEKAY